jgi:hypothetical protein
MRGKLKKVNEGIVFTIDKRPKIGDWYLSSYNLIGKRSGYFINCLYDRLYNSDHKILASTFGVGLELKVNYKGKFQEILNGKYDGVEMDTEYPYAIEDGKVIIEL